MDEKVKKCKRDRIVAFTGVPPEQEQLDDMGIDGMTTTETSQDSNIHYQNTNSGFLLGWMALVTAVVIVIVGLYNAYTLQRDDVVITLTYASNTAFSLAVLVAVILAFKQMAVLTSKDDEIKAARHTTKETESKISVARKMDKDLINITFWALLAFKIMCMIAGYEKSDWLLFSDGIVSIFTCLLQGTQLLFFF